MIQKAFWTLALIGVFGATEAETQSLPIHQIKLPPGFEISIFAENVPNARSMALSPGGRSS
jgi:hypothetical protein